MRALLLVLLALGQPLIAETTYQVLEFKDLPGWNDDDHQKALETFRVTCPDMPDPEWHRLCALALNPNNAKSFFELFFRPVVISDGSEGLFTGYFEPELNGSLLPSPTIKYPVYTVPEGSPSLAPKFTREEIESVNALKGQGLEIAWVDDPVELFFAQIQGSAKIRLPDGSSMRIGYAGNNGHPYKSIGRILADWGVLEIHQLNARTIRDWVAKNPERGNQLLWSNPSYVYFRKLDHPNPDAGPLGAMSWPLTEMRSIAVDTQFVPLGAPVWIEKGGNIPLQRLMVAQDRGSAIKGAQRADIFVGTGDQAGEWAGTMRDKGTMAVLFPIQKAYSLAEGISQ